MYNQPLKAILLTIQAMVSLSDSVGDEASVSHHIQPVEDRVLS